MSPWHIAIIEFLVFGVLLFFIFFFILLIVKKKKHCSIKIEIFLLVTNIFLFMLVQLFFLSHATYYKFNDWFVLHSNIKVIVDKYGKFDAGFLQDGESGMIGYYIYTDNGPIMPDYQKHYYFIYFDENGDVYKVMDTIGFGG